MTRDPRYDILFEPVRLGPKTAKNRFFQVPHCNGMGHERPRAMAAMRGTKAEGGWAVVSTEEVEIHPTSDLSPDIEGRLWDDGDIPALALMTDAVHAHGALAAIQLTHNGPAAANRYTREIPMGPVDEPLSSYDPVQVRAMDLADIRAYRAWHRAAVERALIAGFDVICCYAGHNLGLPMHFLQNRRNTRKDEYGGVIENRARLLREIVEETREVVAGRAAVGIRLAIDELLGPSGITAADEGRAVVAMLDPLVDYWDLNVSSWSNDSSTSRFKPEGSQLPLIEQVRSATKKPIVGVGRFTSPDTMASAVKRGILDFIGAARPSIADPFLPRKIEEGRIDDIRECIGCNICVSGDFLAVPIRCTQNPTMGEEWRRGWHPERIAPKRSEAAVLVVGAGPAGLECARALGQRGYVVSLAEATEQLGGRVTQEAALPGLAEWGRVRDYRLAQLKELSNVAVYRSSDLTVDDVHELGAEHVVIATGATWRRDGTGRAHRQPVPGFERAQVYTPDDLFRGAKPTRDVLVFDDDHYYLGGVLAEKLQREGARVTLVTPANVAAAWTANTLELTAINKRLLELGIRVITQRTVTAFHGDHVVLACIFSGREEQHAATSVVTVTARTPRDQLFRALIADQRSLRSVVAIGDARAPSTIAAAVYAGHRCARELDEPASKLLRERTQDGLLRG